MNSLEQELAARGLLAGLSASAKRNMLLHVLPPEFRRQYLAQHPLDAMRIMRANEKRARKAAAKLDFGTRQHLRPWSVPWRFTQVPGLTSPRDRSRIPPDDGTGTGRGDAPEAP